MDDQLILRHMGFVTKVRFKVQPACPPFLFLPHLSDSICQCHRKIQVITHKSAVSASLASLVQECFRVLNQRSLVMSQRPLECRQPHELPGWQKKGRPWGPGPSGLASMETKKHVCPLGDLSEFIVKSQPASSPACFCPLPQHSFSRSCLFSARANCAQAHPGAGRT